MDQKETFLEILWRGGTENNGFSVWHKMEWCLKCKNQQMPELKVEGLLFPLLLACWLSVCALQKTIVYSEVLPLALLSSLFRFTEPAYGMKGSL